MTTDPFGETLDSPPSPTAPIKNSGGRAKKGKTSQYYWGMVAVGVFLIVFGAWLFFHIGNRYDSKDIYWHPAALAYWGRYVPVFLGMILVSRGSRSISRIRELRQRGLGYDQSPRGSRDIGASSSDSWQ